MHTAGARAPAVCPEVPRTNAEDEPDRLRFAPIAQNNFAACRTGTRHEALELDRGDNVRIEAVSILWDALRVEELESRREDDVAHLDLNELLLLCEVDGMPVRARFDACLLAAPRLQLQAPIPVDDDHLRDGLRERDVDRFALAETHVELVGVLSLLEHARIDALLAADA